MKPWRLIAGLLVLTVSTLATIVVVYLAFPYENDYEGAAADKHQQLSSARGPLMVLAGGSNLAFGIDTAALDRAFDHHVVNMGVTGHVGLRFILEQIRDELDSGDVVVLSLEHPLLLDGGDIDPLNGLPASLLVTLRPWPEGWKYVTTLSQRFEILSSIPEVTHKKLMQVLGRPFRSLLDETAREDPSHSVYTRDQFDRHGDVVTHHGRQRPLEIVQGWDLPGAIVHTAAIQLLDDFRAEMSERGVRVFYAPPAVTSQYLKKEKAAIDLLSGPLEDVFGDHLLGSQERYSLPEAYFFDFVYHLGREGRRIRTKLLIEDLHRALASPGRT